MLLTVSHYQVRLRARERLLEPPLRDMQFWLIFYEYTWKPRSTKITAIQTFSSSFSSYPIMPSLTGSHYEDVSFKTVDGLTLRGWLYPVAGKAPAVIMSPGVLHPLFFIIQYQSII